MRHFRQHLDALSVSDVFASPQIDDPSLPEVLQNSNNVVYQSLERHTDLYAQVVLNPGNTQALLQHFPDAWTDPAAEPYLPALLINKTELLTYGARSDMRPELHRREAFHIQPS